MRFFLTAAVLAAIAIPAGAQSFQRRATITGGGSPDHGKCTIEVVVDGAAEVEIRGDNGTLRNLSGQPPQWRRFECTAPMPSNPASFHFSGVDGRGSQELVRDPRNGGALVVRIEDPQAGAEGYTFDVTWSNGYPADQRQYDLRDYRDNGRYGYRDREINPQFSMDEAVRVCQDAVRQQAAERLGVRGIAFRRTVLDDQPGRGDWIIGSFEVYRGYDRPDIYRFSCSVDFRDGRVRTAQIEPLEGGGNAPGYYGGQDWARRQAMQACERAVSQRMRRNGYGSVEFRSMNVANQYGRNRIVGSGFADGQYRTDNFDFACTMNPANGTVRWVDITRR